MGVTAKDSHFIIEVGQIYSTFIILIIIVISITIIIIITIFLDALASLDFKLSVSQSVSN